MTGSPALDPREQRVAAGIRAARGGLVVNPPHVAPCHPAVRGAGELNDGRASLSLVVLAVLPHQVQRPGGVDGDVVLRAEVVEPANLEPARRAARTGGDVGERGAR